MVDREFVEKLVAYMKNDRSITLKEKSKKFGITPQIYYKLCKKHNIDGRLGSRLGAHNQHKFTHLFSEVSSGTLKCSSSQDKTELFD